MLSILMTGIISCGGTDTGTSSQTDTGTSSHKQKADSLLSLIDSASTIEDIKLLLGGSENRNNDTLYRNSNERLENFMSISIRFKEKPSVFHGVFYLVRPEHHNEQMQIFQEFLDNNTDFSATRDGIRYEGLIGFYDINIVNENNGYRCDSFILEENEIFISYSNYFDKYNYYLKPDQNYSLIFVGEINFPTLNQVLGETVIATFQTPISVPDQRIKKTSTFTVADVPLLGFRKGYSPYTRTTRFYSAIFGQERIHGYASIVADGLTGDGIKVAIVDLLIFARSLAYKAVVYGGLPKYDFLYLSEEERNKYFTDGFTDVLPLYNHGTQMARYMLNYSPGIDIFSINKIRYRSLEYDAIEVIDRENIDIASYSGSDASIINLGSEIVKGLIVSRGLGNITDYANTSESYKHLNVFLPYIDSMLRSENSLGAYVTVQAFHLDPSYYNNENPLENVRGLRTPAGSARFYTLSILENGSGATSEAAATFSGMVALLLEANAKYGSNYTPRQVIEIMFETAIDIGDPGIDNIYGYGAVDLEAALTKIKNNDTVIFRLYENLPEHY